MHKKKLVIFCTILLLVCPQSSSAAHSHSDTMNMVKFDGTCKGACQVWGTWLLRSLPWGEVFFQKGWNNKAPNLVMNTFMMVGMAIPHFISDTHSSHSTTIPSPPSMGNMKHSNATKNAGDHAMQENKSIGPLFLGVTYMVLGMSLGHFISFPTNHFIIARIFGKPGTTDTI